MVEPRILAEDEIREGLARLPGWELREGRLRRQYRFRTFLRAIAFVNAVAYLAEAAGHHPDISINYNVVTVRLITYSKAALTDRDLALALEIDGKLASKLIMPAAE